MNIPPDLITIAADLDEGPTDLEILEVVAQTFDLTPQQAADRLRTMDYEAAKRGVQ